MQRESFEQNNRSDLSSYTVKQPEPLDNTRLLEQLTQIQKAQQRRTWRRISLFLLIFIVAGVTIWQGLGYYQQQSILNQIPSSVRSQIDFPIYLPEYLPDSYLVSKPSARVSSEILFYNLKNADGKEMTISIQLMPIGFDAQKTIEQQKTLDQKQPIAITIPIGTAYNLSSSQNTRYMISSRDNVLLFITSGTKIDDSVVQTLLVSFKLFTK